MSMRPIEDLPFDDGDEITTFEFGDLGNLPEHDKGWYERGKVIVVVGISDGEFSGQYDQPAKSVLHYLPEDNRNEIVNPWGLLIPNSSKVLEQIAGQLRKTNGKPFYAFISKKQGKSFSYWLLESVGLVFNQDGTIGGFRKKDGSMVTNEEKQAPKK